MYEIACEERGEVEVKGLAYPVTAYQVVGPRDSGAEETELVISLLADLFGKDPGEMSASERHAAIAKLSDALEHLTQTETDIDVAE